MLEWIGFAVFIIFALAGVLLSLVGFSGPLLIFLGAVLFNLITWSQAIHFWLLAVLALLAIFGEIVDVFIFFKTKLSAEGWKGLLSGFAIGKSFGLAGVFLGILVGAFFGEWVSNDVRYAWSKVKSLLARKFVSIIIKTLVALLQIWLIISNL